MPSPLRTAVVQATVLGAASNLIAQLVAAYQRPPPPTLDIGASEGLLHALFGWMELDVPQLLRFVLVSLVTAPLNYQFQQLLEHAFPGTRWRRPYAYAHKHKRSDDPEISLQDVHDREREKEQARQRAVLTRAASFPAEPGIDWPNTLIKIFLDAVSLGTFLNNLAFLGIMGLLKGQSSVQIGHNIRTQLAPIVFAGYRIWPIASFISFRFVPLERRIGWNSLVGLFWGIYLSLMAERV